MNPQSWSCIRACCLYEPTDAGVDYVIFSKPVTFAACEDEGCVDIEIVDDDIVEDVEDFAVTLLRDGLDKDIELGNALATIEIFDDDGN